MIKVLVTGAAGRMGKEVLKAVWNTEDLQLVGAIDNQLEGYDVGKFIGSGEIGITIQKDLDCTLKETNADVMVDFTTPSAVFNNIKIALENNVSPVVGTTGMTSGELSEIKKLAGNKKKGCIIASNFAIGALLMMKFAREAVKYFPDVEVIEQHHDQKVDAPSGTAIKTAEALAEEKGENHQSLPGEVENLQGSRGANFDKGIRIHSVRLPGLVAHQEVILGGTGQTLKIRHDSISRESFMPGVILAVKKVVGIEGMVYGLENLIFEN